MPSVFGFRSPEGKGDWRQYPREARSLVQMTMGPRSFYGGNYLGVIPPMYPQDARYPTEWRPPDTRDYYRRPQ